MPPSITLAPKPVNFSKDPIYVDIETDLMSGASAPYTPDEDNLSCYVQIWKKDPAGGDDIFITELNLPYSRWTKKAEFDLSRIIELSIPPPAYNIGAFYTDEVTDNIGVYFFKYANRYGTPAEIEPVLQLSAEYTAILGATRYWQGFSLIPSPLLEILHSYMTESGLIFPKEVRKAQPELIYCWSFTAKTADVIVTFYYTDGSNETYNAGTINVAAKTLHYASVGWDTLALDDQVNGAKTLRYYEIKIGDQNTPPPVQYILDTNHSDYDEYFLYSNGIGGVEVLRTSGMRLQKYKSEKQNYELTRWKGSNFQDGLIKSHSITGFKNIEVNTGYYSRAYCEHLQQLLLADAWYMDRTREKFVKIIIESSDIKVYDDDEDLFFISFTYRPAFNDQSFNTWNI